MVNFSMHVEKHWYVVTEHNEQEGESWNYYVLKSDENMKLIAAIEELVQAHVDACDAHGEDPMYEHVHLIMSRQTLRKLPNNTSYMGEHNEFVKLDEKKVLAMLKKQKIGALYKGELFTECRLEEVGE